MAIVKMNKFTLVTFESHKKELLRKLQGFSKVEFINLQDEEKLEKNEVLKELSKDEVDSNSSEYEENLSKAFYKGDELSISFSAKYLNDAIKSINGEKVKVLFTGEMKPFIIMDFEKDDIIQLVLPVRTY